jgi:hypothetical protein
MKRILIYLISIVFIVLFIGCGTGRITNLNKTENEAILFGKITVLSKNENISNK